MFWFSFWYLVRALDLKLFRFPHWQCTVSSACIIKPISFRDCTNKKICIFPSAHMNWLDGVKIVQWPNMKSSISSSWNKELARHFHESNLKVMSLDLFKWGRNYTFRFGVEFIQWLVELLIFFYHFIRARWNNFSTGKNLNMLLFKIRPQTIHITADLKLFPS